MALLHRFSRLLSADLHAVLERLEDPLILLQQAQRDMAAALAEERSALQRTERAEAATELAVRKGTQRLAQLQTELDLCFEAGNEHLARSVIKQKLHCSADLQLLGDELAALHSQHQELRDCIDRHEQDLATIAAEAERLESQTSRTAPSPNLGVAATNSISEEAIELALLAERRARSLES